MSMRINKSGKISAFNWVALMAMCAVMLASITVASAATLTVTSTADSGPGTLREAIDLASDGDTINFASDVNEVVLTSTYLLIDKNITISNTNPGPLTVRRSSADGTPQFRIFYVTVKTVIFSRLTISNGYSTESNLGGGALLSFSGNCTFNDCILTGNSAAPGRGGGAILTVGGTLNLSGCTISENTISGSTSGARGAGIYCDPCALTMVDCTVSNNTLNLAGTSAGYGGGLAIRGGIADLTNCTISGNTVVTGYYSQGGGFYCDPGDGSFSGVTVRLTNCTISGNSVTAPVPGPPPFFETDTSDGGGLYIFFRSNTPPVVHLKNTIVSGNSAATHPDIFGPLTTDDHNLIGGDAKLGLLQDNGGPTQTMALLSGSPALDAGTNSGAPSTDQRGQPRPIDQTAIPNATDGTDIGAFEAGDLTPPPTITFISPSQDYLFKTASFGTVSGSVTDHSGSGIARVELVVFRRWDEKRWTASGWQLGGDTPFSTTPAKDGTWSFQGGVAGVLPRGINLLDGNYYLYAYAYDNFGNRSVATLGVSVDARPPLPPIIKHPVAGSYIPRFSTVVISGTATDTMLGTGIAQVELFLQRATNEYWDGSAWVGVQTALSTTLSNGRSWSRGVGLPDSSQAPNGDYKLSARATDRAGHVSLLSTPITVTVDGTRPTVSIDAIAPGQTADSLRSITGTASDNIAVASVTVRLYRYGNGGSISAGYRRATNVWTLPYNPSAHELAATSTSPNFATWSYDLPSAAQGLEPGQYLVRATVKDVTGWTSYVQEAFTIMASGSGSSSSPES